MKQLIEDIKRSFKERPVWTVYALILSPFAYLSLFITAVLVAMVHLSIEDGIDFWRDNS